MCFFLLSNFSRFYFFLKYFELRHRIGFFFFFRTFHSIVFQWLVFFFFFFFLFFFFSFFLSFLGIFALFYLTKLVEYNGADRVLAQVPSLEPVPAPGVYFATRFSAAAAGRNVPEMAPRASGQRQLSLRMQRESEKKKRAESRMRTALAPPHPGITQLIPNDCHFQLGSRCGVRQPGAASLWKMAPVAQY